MDPYESSGFIDLLNSQQRTHSLEPNLYDSVSPRIELDESQDPFFGTQWRDAPSQGDRRSRKKWTPTEDVMLISAWLNTSKDPIVGNEQKAKAFWKRIAAYVASSPKLAGLEKREASHCKQRWRKINELVCKFVGCYEAASSQKSSGQNDNDVMKLAHHIYFNVHQSKFTLEHAWRELRHDQKWCKKEGSGMSKRRRPEEGSTQSSSSHPVMDGDDEAIPRPCGIKASKGKAKRKLPKAVDEDGTLEVSKQKMLEFKTMWEIKQQDAALTDKLNKQKLLENLLAKTEPLSDIEVALKNKLINDMLSNA